MLWPDDVRHEVVRRHRAGEACVVIADDLSQRLGRRMTADAVRGIVQRMKDAHPETLRRETAPPVLLSNRPSPGVYSLLQLADFWDVAPKVAQEQLRLHVERGLASCTGDQQFLFPPPQQLLTPQPPQQSITADGVWRRFALVSDTHGGSSHEQLKALHQFYDKCVELGVTTVFHAGDISHGLNVYRGQYLDLKPIGWGYEQQVQYVAETYPQRQGIQTYFIGGNHDEDALKHGAADPGERLEELRDDVHYLGMYAGFVDYQGLRVQLQHGRKGEPYARSYALQKILEKLPRVDLSEHPHILVMGHYHVFCTLPDYQNVEAYLPGGFEGRNNLLKQMGIYPRPGGYILEARLEGNEVVELVERRIKYALEREVPTQTIKKEGIHG
mgnify:CR=1 FL=1